MTHDDPTAQAGTTRPHDRAPIRIREARDSDAPEMHRIVEAAYRGTGVEGPKGWTSESHLVGGDRTSVGEIAAMVASPAELMLAAVMPAADAGASRETPSAGQGSDQGAAADAEVLVGCCCVHRPGGGDELPEFGMFAVDPGVQAGGIGSALLSEACARARAEGGEAMEIRVLQSRPELRDWYERRGFVPTGEVRPFPGDPAGLKRESLGMDVLVRDLGRDA